MEKTETGESETTEQTHYHYCSGCEDVWAHQDDLCNAPQYGSLINHFDCPMCLGQR